MVWKSWGHPVGHIETAIANKTKVTIHIQWTDENSVISGTNAQAEIQRARFIYNDEETRIIGNDGYYVYNPPADN